MCICVCMRVYIYLYVYTYFYSYLQASPEFNPLQVEMSMMHLSPAWQLIHSPSQQRSGSSCWNVVKQQLFHHCSDGQNPAQNLPNFFLKATFTDCRPSQMPCRGWRCSVCFTWACLRVCHWLSATWTSSWTRMLICCNHPTLQGRASLAQSSPGTTRCPLLEISWGGGTLKVCHHIG